MKPFELTDKIVRGNALTRRYGDVLALRAGPAAKAASSLRALGAAG